MLGMCSIPLPVFTVAAAAAISSSSVVNVKPEEILDLVLLQGSPVFHLDLYQPLAQAHTLAFVCEPVVPFGSRR